MKHRITKVSLYLLIFLLLFTSINIHAEPASFYLDTPKNEFEQSFPNKNEQHEVERVDENADHQMTEVEMMTEEKNALSSEGGNTTGKEEIEKNTTRKKDDTRRPDAEERQESNEGINGTFEIESGNGNTEERNHQEVVAVGPELFDSPKNKHPMNQEEPSGTDLQESSIMPTGLLRIRLLNNATLDIDIRQSGNGKQRIHMVYEGEGLINVALLENSYIIFHLPREIADEMTIVNATYDVPAVGLLIPILRNRGSFSPADIEVGGSQVYMNFKNLLSLNLLSRTNYIFTLTIELDRLPPTPDGEYLFIADATRKLVDLSLFAEDYARTKLPAPKIPDAPILDEPIYTTDSIVTGSGEPSSTIIVKIGEEQYSDFVDSNGNFAVSIPNQQAGTEIRAVIVNDDGIESEETTAVVEEPPDATPPEPPIVDEVYSNDTVVTGRGEEFCTVVVTIEGKDFFGQTCGEGRFSVDIPAQLPGTVISVVLIDEAGNVSRPTTTIVKEATISFTSVPENIEFSTTKIEPGTVRIRFNEQQRDDRL